MKYLEYYSIIKEQLDAQFEEERENIEKAAEYCSNSIMNERLVHVLDVDIRRCLQWKFFL